MAGRTYFAGLGGEQIQPLLSEEERPVNGTMVLLNPMVLLDAYAGPLDEHQRLAPIGPQSCGIPKLGIARM